jgi:Fe-S-cluster-containing dehydrogenase component
MIEVHSSIAAKCDYCGGDPACVKECFPGALVFEEKTSELTKLKGKQMRQRSDSGTPAEKRENLGKALLSSYRN